MDQNRKEPFAQCVRTDLSEKLEAVMMFVDETVVRCTVLPKNETTEDFADVLDQPCKTYPASLIRKPDFVKISTDACTVVISRDPFRFFITNRMNKEVVRTIEQEALCVSDTGSVLRLKLSHDEKIYGLGQDPMANLNQHGFERRMWNATDRRRKSGNIGIPFYHSDQGYGFLLLTYEPCRFAIGRARVADPPHERKDPTGIDPNPYPWPFDEKNPYDDPSDVAIVSDAPVFDALFFIEDGSDRILERYGALTGRPPLPPMWAFGFLQSKNRYRSMEELLFIAQRHRKQDVPLSALIIDWLWFEQFGDFCWSTRYWPNPKAGIDALSSMGIRVMIALHPYVDRESLNYTCFQKAGYLQNVPKGTRPTLDFSNPDVASMYWERIVKPLWQTGIRGWWTDMSEPEDHPVGTISKKGAREKIHNVYANLWNGCIYRGQRRDAKERVFLLSRSGYAGIQKFGVAIWSNDIEARWVVLQEQVVLSQTMALSGVPYWCTDTGGFVTLEEFSAELLIRWYQWGVFCPIFRTHGTRADNEYWSFGPLAQDAIVSMIKLRYRLIPYIYALAYVAHTENRPMVRAMCMDFPEDETAAAQTNQYMFGPYMLIAPVVQKGARSRRLYLPKGQWYDFWSNETYTGGRFLTVYAPIDRIPVFIRAGALIPMRQEDSFEQSDEVGKMVMYAYPGAPGHFVTYEDDGLGYDYEKGVFGLRQWTQDASGKVRSKVLHASGPYPKNPVCVKHVKPKPEQESVRCDAEAFVSAEGVTVNACVYNRTDRPIVIKAKWKTDSRLSDREIGFCESLTLAPGNVWSEHNAFNTQEGFSPAMEQGTMHFVIDDGQKTITCNRTVLIGTGFPTNFLTIGDFPYDPDLGIETGTPVEENPEAMSYRLDQREVVWERPQKNFNDCMGYVYCWKRKVESGPRPVSYARACVWSPDARQAWIECSGDRAIKIWVNGVCVFTSDRPVIFGVLDESVPLLAGRNRILIKVAQNQEKPYSGRELGFQFRFVNSQGECMHDLLYAP